MAKQAATARRVTTFRIDEELLSGLQEVWTRDGVAVSEQVRRAIRAWLETKNPKEAKRRVAHKRR